MANTKSTSKKKTSTSKAKVSNTQLSVVKDGNVPAMLEMITNELQSLDRISESNYRTGGNIPGIGDIREMTKTDDLIRAHASVRIREKSYNDSIDELGLDSAPQFKIGGGTSEDWTADIKLRIEIITHHDRKQRLEKARDKMKTFLSEEDQKQIVMQEIASLLK